MFQVIMAEKDKIVISEKYKLVYTIKNFAILIMIVFGLTYAYVLLTYEGRDWLVFNKLRFNVQNLQYNSNYNPNIEGLFYDDFDVQIVDKNYKRGELKPHFNKYNISQCLSGFDVSIKVPDRYYDLYNDYDKEYLLISKYIEGGSKLQEALIIVELVPSFLRFYRIGKIKVPRQEDIDYFLEILNDCKKDL